MTMNNIPLHCRCRFNVAVGAPDKTGKLTEPRVEVVDNKNMILDRGLTQLLSTSVLWKTFHLGIGTTAVERTQTSLASPLPSGYGIFNMTGGTGTVTTGTDEVGPYVQWSGSGQSPIFQANQNLTEIGFAIDNSPSTICSRALTRNSEGTPTAIPVLVAEVVVVTYIFRLYLAASTASGSIVLTTDGAVTSVDWTSGSNPGQVLSLGSGSGLSFINLDSGVIIGGSSRTLTLGTPTMTSTGATNTASWTKLGNTGNTTVSGYVSSTAARSVPVNIQFSPSIVVTNDQRATFTFVYELTQDYS